MVPKKEIGMPASGDIAIFFYVKPVYGNLTDLFIFLPIFSILSLPLHA
jgi:hypothetical protein